MATVNRRLSARRGSTTAPDPFGVHATVNLDPNRTSSSTLTIVRVPVPAAATPPVPFASNEPPASPVLGARRPHRRLGRDAPGAPAPTDPPAGRLSFAFSSFGSGGGPRASSPSSSHPPSPSSSPRLRPSSPHLGPSFGSAGKPRLTPDQLVDLARQATHLRPDSAPGGAQPATFTPLPEDIFLPFIDRPAEVAALISSPPDVKLFTLLAQTFPKSQPVIDPVTAIGLAEKQPQTDLPRDPANWSYAQLVFHLTKIDRDVAPDFIWTIAARKCILTHSELIWERIKGALGVPPELDVEYDFLDDDQESPDTSDISDDEGRGARGHWSDWDAVMDSPVATRNKRLSMESPSTSSYFAAKREEQDAKFRAQIEDRLHGLNESGYVQSSSTTPGDEVSGGDATTVPSPHGVRSPSDSDQEGIIFGTFSPPTITHREPTIDEHSEYLSIEPLLAPATAPPNPFSPPAGADGLGDIAEGAEEEEEAAETAAEAPATSPSGHLSPHSASGMISPSQIQGLRISTSPIAPSTLATPPVMSPVSPLPPYPPVPSSSANSIHSGSGAQPQAIPAAGAYAGSRSHSRASSFSSIGPFQRSESTGNLSASWIAMAAAAAGAESSHSVFGSEAGDSSGYISDGDRGAGAPLFPSNFARLAGGPTMRANNPATRASGTVPHARYRAGGKVRTHSTTHAAGLSAGLLRTASGSDKRRSWGAGSVPTTSSGA